jgi:AcrR family transcriptional regulator
MPILRSDAARNRDRILDAARTIGDDGREIQLNAVAHRAGVGIGTVYRHFASPQALAEGLAEPRFARMIDAATRAALEPNTFAALRNFLEQSLQIYVESPAFAAAVLAPNPVREETRVLRRELLDAFSKLVHSAANHFRPDLEPLDLMILICGLGYSARLRPDRSGRYLDALLNGILAA